MMEVWGMIAYIVFSQLALSLLAWTMLVTIAVAFILSMLALGGLAWKVAQRVGWHEKRVDENTLTLPTPRAGKIRRRYLG